MNIRSLINHARLILAVVPIVIMSSACLNLTSSSPINRSIDPSLVVDDFHSAVNGNDEHALLSLFTDDATVLDNGQVIEGMDAIREWSVYSQQMAGIQLNLIKSEVNGDTLTWLDLAHHGPAIDQINYIVQWEAILHEGKVQSLSVMPRYWPDLK